MTARLRVLSFGLACVFLCMGFGLQAEWAWSGGFLLLGIAGCFLLLKYKWPVGLAGFTIILIAAVAGIFLNISLWSALLAVVAGLGFWDLDAFNERLTRVPASEETLSLEKVHHKRLLLALGIGGGLVLFSLLIDFRLSLGWAILLGLAVILLVRLGIRSLTPD